MQTPRVATGAVVRSAERRILLIRRGPAANNGAGEWMLPGGKLEPLETLASGAGRRLAEEVGVEGDMVFTGIITEDIHWGHEQHFVTHYFQAVSWRGYPRIMEQHKHDGIRWVDEDRLREAAERPDRELPLSPTTRDFVVSGGLEALVPWQAGDDLPGVRPIAEIKHAMADIAARCHDVDDDVAAAAIFEEALRLMLEIRIPRMPDTQDELADILRRSSEDAGGVDSTMAFDTIRKQGREFSVFLEEFRHAVAIRRWEDATNLLLPLPEERGIRWNDMKPTMRTEADGSRAIIECDDGEPRTIVAHGRPGTSGLAAIMEAHLLWDDVWRR